VGVVTHANVFGGLAKHGPDAVVKYHSDISSDVCDARDRQPREHMRNDQRNKYLTRNGILKMLSDEEVARVSAAETKERLMDGEVYVDLTRLEQGVRRARGETTPTRPVLPKKAIEEKTWKSILEHLAVLESASRNSKT
jgi:hypothetical protein